MSHASSHLIVRILHSLVIFVLLGVFGYQLYSNIKNINVPSLTYSVKTENALVPPALTFCLTRNSNYSFTIKVYNVTVDKGAAYLQMFPADSNQLNSLKGQVARCWILSPPVGSDRALLKNPPPVANVPDIVFTTTRSDDGGIVSPLLVNIFDPLQRDSLFDFNRFLSLNPDSNRAIQFTRTKRINVDGSIINGIQYNIIDEFRSPDQTIPGVNSTNQFTFRAASFDVEVTKEVILVTVPVAIFNALTFLGVLISSVYIPLVGPGRYRPWGYINRLTSYYPVEHIKQSSNNIETELKKNDPTIEEKLEIYLDRVGKAKYYV